jgi:signal transduction histidine kinase
LYNIIYYIGIKRIRQTILENFLTKKFINLQITIDFIVLTVVLHYSGGIENPILVFYIFHMIISSILLSKLDSYIQTTIAIILFFLLAYLEYSNVIKHISINPNLTELLYNDKYYLIFAFSIFILTSYFVVYMMTTIVGQLRIRQRDLNTANEELLKKDKIKDEYVQRVTHDIKGHLAVVRSSVEIMERRSLGEINEKYSKVIQRASKRTEAVIDFIQELLKITNLRLKNQKSISIFPIIEVIKKSIKATEALASDKNIDLKYFVENNTENTRGEAFSIEEAITNLLLNAVKYTPANGTINLKARSENNFVVIDISDTGIGIPEEDIENVFNEFYRASNVKSTHEGNGLGLALVKQIIARQYGKVSVESKIGEGSTFTIMLPSYNN